MKVFITAGQSASPYAVVNNEVIKKSGLHVSIGVYLGRKCQIFGPRLVQSFRGSRSLGNLSKDCRIYRAADFCVIRVIQDPLKWVGGNLIYQNNQGKCLSVQPATEN